MLHAADKSSKLQILVAIQFFVIVITKLFGE
jgi:hypothetical protein